METLNLTHGSHSTPEEGMCLMEAVAFLAGEDHSDHPECACPVISAFGQALNDRMGKGAGGDALRAKYLASLAEKLVGTRATSEVEQKRAYFFADRAVRLFAPMALESAGLGEDAARLRSLAEVVDEKTARNADAAAWVAVASATAAAAADSAAYAAARAADAATDADSATARAADSAAYAAASAASWAASWAAAAASWAAAAAAAEAWEQAAKAMIEACEITEGGE